MKLRHRLVALLNVSLHCFLDDRVEITTQFPGFFGTFFTRASRIMLIDIVPQLRYTHSIDVYFVKGWISGEQVIQ
ncbi:MAG: hypothetical protein ACK42H_19100, partial [Planctomycetota bacterium]